TERYIPFASRTAKADFNAVNSVIDLESGYKMDLGNSVLFRPFAGIVGNAVIYSGFNETGADFLNLHVNGDTLFTSAAKAGAKLFYDSNIYNVYGGAELRYLLSGNTPEISSTFEGQDAAFNSKGDERDRMMYGLNLGAEFKTSDNCRIFANLSSFISNGYTDYSWNAGIRYAFPNIYPR
ncbi:MAG: autotransporter outer membrane beta-barrel domain-containing protein, partial [Elusimicrobiota bacterium]|nr:autotransporter outer membrane beta-barrel domain-containing protein [Elusimicrobiota bacterium]